MAAPRAPRLDAREQLHTAHQLFNDFGMEAFAERARVELEATGEHPRNKSPRSCSSAPAPFDYHLRKAFRKLGVKSRTRLAHHVLQPGTRREPCGAGELTRPE